MEGVVQEDYSWCFVCCICLLWALLKQMLNMGARKQYQVAMKYGITLAPVCGKQTPKIK